MNAAWFSTLATAAPLAEGQPNLLVQFAPIALIVLIFYFLLIAPARKKQKQHAAMIENLKAGDKIITNGGIHGTVVGVTESILQVRIADQVKIEISKNAVAALQDSEGG